MCKQNTTFKAEDCLKLCYDCSATITPALWAAQCRHTIQEEQKAGNDNRAMEHAIEQTVHNSRVLINDLSSSDSED